MAVTGALTPEVARAVDALTEFGATEVYLFGSVLTSSWEPESDLDVAVVGLRPEAFFRAMARVSDIVRRRVDLVDLGQDTPFTRYLRSHGEELLRVR